MFNRDDYNTKKQDFWATVLGIIVVLLIISFNFLFIFWRFGN